MDWERLIILEAAVLAGNIWLGYGLGQVVFMAAVVFAACLILEVLERWKVLSKAFYIARGLHGPRAFREISREVFRAW